MASRSEEELSCRLCSDTFKDPVCLSCNHSFCKDCLRSYWAGGKTPECPVCRRWASMLLPFHFEQEKSAAAAEPLCHLHFDKFSFFCLDDEQLLCNICRDSETHSSHRIQPVDEAVRDHERRLRELLKPLRKKLTLIDQIKQNCDQTAEHIKAQAETTAQRIKEEFRKLHDFLYKEEETRMAALREEEEQKMDKMKQKIEALSREIAALSEPIGVTEEQLRAGDMSLLFSYKAAVDRVQQQCLPDDPQLNSGALIDEAKHLGNLRFNIWNKMKDMVSYSPLILDPNSAHPDLILSEDLTCVRQGKARQQLPDNPERINPFFSIVGSVGFRLGSHSWVVEVGDNKAFSLGVLAESSTRKINPWSELWRIVFCDGAFRSVSPSDTGSDVAVKEKPRRIRVQLDQDRGRLSFYNSDTNTNIHTFSHNFSTRMFPYIGTWSGDPVKIVSSKVSVTVEQIRSGL